MKAALQSGAISQSRLDDMVERILWALFAKGAVDNPVKVAPIDYAANAKVSQKAAEESLVLLKNDGDLLPLRGVKSIAVIGGNADKGVLAGGGSSDVTPVGGAVMIDKHTYMPSPAAGGAQGANCRARRSASMPAADLAAAAALAAASDVAIVFVTQHNSEGYRRHAWSLRAIRTRSSRRSPRPIPRPSSWSKAAARCSCPGRRKCPAILEAFYPGIRGGAGDRSDPDRQGQSVGPPADHLPRLTRPAGASGAPGPWPAGRDAGADHLRRRRGGRVQMA